MISLEHVSKTYPLDGRIVEAVKDVTFTVNQGDFLIITGRSGSGKTTLLNLMAGLTRPTSGQVKLCGNEVWKQPDREQAALRNRMIGFVFQFPSLMPSLNVLENVLLPTVFQPPADITLRGPMAQGDGERRARALLAEVGLSDKLAAYPRQLSAGQQQRVVIARAHQPT
jgi:ABC-type lipoprotein export system ATPase subunit